MPMTENEAESLYYGQIWPLVSITVGLRPLHFWSIRSRAKIKEGEKVLEIGAGYPLFRMYSQNVGDEGLFVSLDIHQNIQRRSKWIIGGFSKASLKFVTADAFKLPFRDEVFDVVIENNFAGDGQPPIKEVYRILKPGGRFLASFDEMILLPPVTDEIEEDCKRLGFINVKGRWGAIGGIIPIFWNRVVQATKPL